MKIVICTGQEASCTSISDEKGALVDGPEGEVLKYIRLNPDVDVIACVRSAKAPELEKSFPGKVRILKRSAFKQINKAALFKRIAFATAMFTKNSKKDFAG